MKLKKIVVLSDIQAPSHDGRAITTLQEFIEKKPLKLPAKYSLSNLF